MFFYTVTEKSEGAISLPKGLFIEKKEYDEASTRAFLSYAKHFYIRIDTESETTDFNDRYSDSCTRYIPCNAENLIIKDGTPYGFIAYGLDRFEDTYIVLSEEAPHAWDGEHSGYSSLDRDFYLRRYELDEAVMSTAMHYRLITTAKNYKVKDGRIMEKTQSVSERIRYFTAFDVAAEDGAPLVLKADKISFRIPDEENEIKHVTEAYTLGVREYRTFYTFRLEKLWES